MATGLPALLAWLLVRTKQKRPYASSMPMMSTEDWQKIPPSTVHLDDLEMQQDHLYMASLMADNMRTYTGDTYPYVVDFNGKKYVEDGHHRVVRRKLIGRKTIKARVYTHNASS